MEETEKSNKNDKTLSENLKIAGLTALNAAELIAGAGLIWTIPVVGVPLTVDGAFRLNNKLTGAKNNGSMITTISNYKNQTDAHRIVQNFSNLGDILKPIGIREKELFLLTQELNFLLTSDKKDKSGEPITYNTSSQALTKKVLRDAQKVGLIQNFEAKNLPKRRLIMEKLTLGNFKNLFRKEGYFDMSFSISEKDITEEQIIKFLGVKELSEDKFNIKRDENGKITSVNIKQSYAWKDRFYDIGQKIKSHLPWNKNKSLPSAKEETIGHVPESVEAKQTEVIEGKTNPTPPTATTTTIAMYRSEVYPPEDIANRDIERKNMDSLNNEIETKETKEEVKE